MQPSTSELPEPSKYSKGRAIPAPSDIIIAEVTNPSLGVGYEIGRAIENNKKIICLYRGKEGKKLSAMIAGSNDLILENYSNIESAKKIIKNYLK